MGDKIYTDTPPKCDFCDLPAKVDGKTNQGPWANMCAKHNTLYGCGKLGTGYGQEFKPTSEKPPVVVRHAEDLDMDDLEDMVFGDSNASTSCPEGCEVEPDGTCPHGYSSHLLELGII
jgi:hypothetical protein